MKSILYKIILLLGIAASPVTALAQVTLPEELRPEYLPSRPGADSPEQQVQSLVGDILTTAMYITGGLAVVLIIITAIRLVVSMGEESATTAAKKSMVGIIAGLLVLLTSLIIIRFVVQITVGIQEL
jgi:hypothetical protein